MDKLIERIDKILPTIVVGAPMCSDFELLMKELGYPHKMGDLYPTAEKSVEFLKKKREELNG